MRLNLMLFFLYPLTAFCQQFSMPWGEVAIDDPRLEELIAHPVMQRLKNIDQSGPVTYLGLMPSFSRFEHSVGVLTLLLEKTSASFDEQVAALLHDSSHTAFSHLGDKLFYQEQAEHSYQDIIHLEFLETLGIPEVTKQWGISLADLDPDSPKYRGLEQPLPDLCADRIEYLLHTAEKIGIYSVEEITSIVAHLQFENERWFFTDREKAEQFARLSLHFTQEIYGSAWNNAAYHLFAQILITAMNDGLITADEIRYGTDDMLISKLEKEGSVVMQEQLAALQNKSSELYATTPEKQNADLWVQPKFRGVNPWIRTESGSFLRLTEACPNYDEQYQSVKEWCSQGYGLTFHGPFFA